MILVRPRRNYIVWGEGGGGVELGEREGKLEA